MADAEYHGARKHTWTACWRDHGESFVVPEELLGLRREMEPASHQPPHKDDEYLPPKPRARARPHLDPKNVMALAEAVHPRYRCLVLAMGVLALRSGDAHRATCSRDQGSQHRRHQRETQVGLRSGFTGMTLNARNPRIRVLEKPSKAVHLHPPMPEDRPGIPGSSGIVHGRRPLGCRVEERSPSRCSIDRRTRVTSRKDQSFGGN
jgi:hypothetical protein